MRVSRPRCSSSLLAQVTENERRESFRIEGGGVWQPTLVTAKGLAEAEPRAGFPLGVSAMVSMVAVDEPDGEEGPESASGLSEQGSSESESESESEM